MAEKGNTLKAYLDRNGLGAMFVSNPLNVRYFSGYTGTFGFMVQTGGSGGKGYFLTDGRYKEQAKAQVKGFELVQVENVADLFIKTAEICRQNKIEKIAFEEDHVTCQQLRRLGEAAKGVEFFPAPENFTEIRSGKTVGEIAAIRKAIAAAEEALASVMKNIRPGTSEKEISEELEIEIIRRGGERSFDFIVASGERSALPHGVASDKKIKKGEFLTIDWGARVSGYCSDQTVTFAIGNPNKKQEEIYSTVKTAHDLAIEKLRPGMTCKELDAIARDHICSKGYGEYFDHSLGHGVGLAIHEFPRLAKTFDDVLVAENMVITIEPGIYVPGFGGVRIEDMVLVTAKGCEVLTTVDKTLKVIN